MLIGMAIVFTFLIILIIYMKSVPVLSSLGLFSKRSSGDHGQRDANRLSEPESSDKQQNSNEPKLKLNSMLQHISDQDRDQIKTGEKISELQVAAIAAGIYSITGKKPKQLVITTPSGVSTHYNLWGVAGRQEQMLARDVTGQVGFQY